MQNRWIGKNVDLELLVTSIKEFFESKGWKPKVERFGKAYIISSIVSCNDEKRRVTLNVFGNPNDFSVKILEGDDKRTYSLIGSLATLFGGGVFVLKGLKSAELYEKIGNEILSFVDEIVAGLVNSQGQC